MRIYINNVKRKRRRKNLNKRLLDVFIFLVKLLILSIPLHLILIYNVSMYPLQVATREGVRSVLMHFYDVKSEGMLMDVNGFKFLISDDCTGWKSMLLFVALVLAFPGVEMWRRLSGIVFFLPVVFLGNILRIILIVAVQQNFGTEAAMVFHNYFWQFGLSAIVLASWVFWIVFFTNTNIKIKPLKIKLMRR